MTLSPGLLFTKTTGLSTTEDDGTDYFTVALSLEPRHDVVLTFRISNGNEGLFQASGNVSTSVTFTAANWNVAQTITLVGVDDGKPLDGDMAYVIQTTVSSDDLRYDGMRSGAGLPIANITVTNVDNDGIDEWYGDAGAVVAPDFHTGGNGSSDLYGENGRDEIHGGNGDDRVYGGYGDDVLYGEADNDELEGDQGNDKLNGGSGDDTLTGGTGKDTLLGGDGNDTLDGSSDVDSMDGGNGSDTYYVDNAADIVSDSGTDGGIDTVYVTAFLAHGYTLGTGINNAALTALANDASLTGNASDNGLTGNDGANALDGGLGNDVLAAGGGNDTLLGGDGSDVLAGGAGNDSLSGGAGDDAVDYSDSVGSITVDLSAGSATGEGTDILVSIEDATGGAGADSLTGSAAGNELTGGSGNDSLFGGGGDDILYSGDGNDSVDAGDGNDLIVGGDGAGDDRYTGGAGTDTVKYTSANTAIRVDLTSGTASGADIGSDTLAQIENVIGGKGNDALIGSASANRLDGYTGNDAMDGGAGNDTMLGGLGNDTYYVRQSGDQVTEAAAAGTDVALSYLSSYTLTTNVENGRIMSAGTASITGNASSNTLYAAAGNNALNGGTGTDTVSYAYASTAIKVSLALATGQITGGSGTDTLTSIESLVGGSANDSLTGSALANSLSGGAGNDILSAGAGNDVLVGGLGGDKLTGGTGADRFDFNALAEMGLSSSTWDTITDFKTSEGDKIDLMGVDANTALTGNQAFTYLGAVSTFTGNATGQLRFDATAHILYGSTDTDTAAEFAIALTGVSSLASADLVL
jgi:Ca2+-binding RTX toxin-like protein